MSNEEKYFLETAKNIMDNGIDSNDRTGVGTKYLFSQKFDYDISNGKIPIWTTRKIPWKNQVVELIWFIRGDTNTKFLKDRGINIWDSWTDKNGSVGPIYGQQLRAWETPNNDPHFVDGDSEVKVIDQLQILVDGIKKNPESRRHIITLWNAGIHNELSAPYLPPCHSNHIQIVINEKTKELYYQYVQRSADFLIGYCPWQHALFANIIGNLTGYAPKQLSAVITNCHIYKNQFTPALEQIARTPTDFPTLKINKKLQTLADVESCELSDFDLIDYNPQSVIKFPIAI